MNAFLHISIISIMQIMNPKTRKECGVKKARLKSLLSIVNIYILDISYIHYIIYIYVNLTTLHNSLL